MSRFLSTCALLGALLSSPAASASNGDIDAMTLLGDWRGRIGQTIGISGCTLVSAIPHLVICLVKSKHGHPDSFLVDTSAMAADDLARAFARLRQLCRLPHMPRAAGRRSGHRRWRAQDHAWLGQLDLSASVNPA